MLDFWFKQDEKIRFLLIGGINFVISYLLYVILCTFLGQNAFQIALAASWVFSSFISFTTQKFLVFQSKGNWISEYVKCCTTWAISYIINAALLQILVKICGLNIYISQFIAVSTAAVFTYFMFKKFAQK